MGEKVVTRYLSGLIYGALARCRAIAPSGTPVRVHPQARLSVPGRDDRCRRRSLDQSVGGRFRAAWNPLRLAQRNDAAYPLCPQCWQAVPPEKPVCGTCGAVLREIDRDLVQRHIDALRHRELMLA